jgi:hypothetical protein
MVAYTEHSSEKILADAGAILAKTFA